jgi:hypothetical protein
MVGTRVQVRSICREARVALGLAVAAFSCGGANGVQSTIAPAAPDGGTTCGDPAPVADLCSVVARATLTPCGRDADGQPTQLGYFEIQNPDGSKVYSCATSWGESTGYWFDHPNQLMSDPQSCCGSSATPVAPPAAPQPKIGYLGAPHPPHDIKPQETAQPGDGLIRENPFATIIRDSSDAVAFETAFASWTSWAGDGQPHPAADGSGAYYFPLDLLLNYTIVATTDESPIVVLGPEVSLTSDEKTPLGHPTLGACTSGGGAALALMAGELQGTTLSNHSGRFGYDPSETQDALGNAQKLFTCLGLPITSTIYYPPKP